MTHSADPYVDGYGTALVNTPRVVMLTIAIVHVSGALCSKIATPIRSPGWTLKVVRTSGAGIASHHA
jgi:hypothetical protein